MILQKFPSSNLERKRKEIKRGEDIFLKVTNLIFQTEHYYDGINLKTSNLEFKNCGSGVDPIRTIIAHNWAWA